VEDINLKLASIVEAGNLQSCALDAFEEDSRKYGSYPPNIESLEWIESQINAGNFFLIIWQDQLVGGLCAELDSDELVEVKYVFVASSFQGKSSLPSLILLHGRSGHFAVAVEHIYMPSLSKQTVLMCL
jgi:hypothetical protein